MRATILCISFLLSVAIASVDAQVITASDGNVCFDAKLRYLKNEDVRLSLDKALEALEQNQFIANDSEYPLNFGYDSSDFWFYIDFEIAEGMERVIYLPYPYHQNIDFYINKENEWKKISTGNLAPFHTRGDFQPENYAWPFRFEKGSKVQVMINVKSRAPVIMSLELQTIENYITSANTRNLLYGIFFGILIIMVLYNLFLYVIVRDIAYLYYVLLVLTNIAVFSAVTGYAFHYLHPDTPEVNYFIREFLISFLIIPTSLFAIVFLDLKKHSIILYNALRGMIVIGVFTSVLICFKVVFGFSSFIISFHAPLLLFIGIVVRIKGNVNASFYILAWTGYLLGGLAMTLRNAGVLPANLFTDHGAEIGAVLDVFLLALALAYRYRQIRNESSRLQRANLALVEQQNVMLEEKVKARTQQLDSTLEIVQKQRDVLNLKNLEINSSIDYALKIQESMFPKREDIARTFDEVTLFHQPKHTVSGDFAFFDSVGSLSFVAVVDCTGHGVPGAMMSMAGYNLFYDAVNIERLKQPSDILAYVEANLKMRLHQNEQLISDGMEVSLCVINRKKRTVSYCGAQRPLLMITEGQPPQLIKGTKKAIGGHLLGVDSQFIDHELALNGATTLYLYSDGFQDQFGGDHDKKYLSKRLVNYLHSIASQDGAKQEALLRSEFDQWRGDAEQIDDVLVLGVRV